MSFSLAHFLLVLFGFKILVQTFVFHSHILLGVIFKLIVDIIDFIFFNLNVEIIEIILNFDEFLSIYFSFLHFLVVLFGFLILVHTFISHHILLDVFLKLIVEIIAIIFNYHEFIIIYCSTPKFEPLNYRSAILEGV